MKRSLFLDMDGTIIVTKSGKTFPEGIDDWKFKEGVVEKIKESYNDEYDHIIIVSNQAGIHYGYFSNEEIAAKFDYIKKILNRRCELNGDISYIFCPEKEGFLRKPNPGMGYEIASQLEINLKDSLMVGDASGKENSFSDSDKKFAENCGMKYIDIEDFLN